MALHPFFFKERVPFRFEHLRQERGAQPPFVPHLKSEIDCSYFDDFNDPEDSIDLQDHIPRLKDSEGVDRFAQEYTHEKKTQKIRDELTDLNSLKDLKC